MLGFFLTEKCPRQSQTKDMGKTTYTYASDIEVNLALFALSTIGTKSASRWFNKLKQEITKASCLGSTSK
jgi:hypothetical protein